MSTTVAIVLLVLVLARRGQLYCDLDWSPGNPSPRSAHLAAARNPQLGGALRHGTHIEKGLVRVGDIACRSRRCRRIAAPVRAWQSERRRRAACRADDVALACGLTACRDNVMTITARETI